MFWKAREGSRMFRHVLVASRLYNNILEHYTDTQGAIERD
jgi:hypothetical protein